MVLFLIIFLILFSLIFFLKDYISKRMLSIYLAYWALAIFLCVQGVFSIKVSTTTFVFVYIHLFAFCFGFLISKQGGKPKSYKPRTDICKEQVDRILNNPIIRIIIIVTTVYFVTLYAAFFARVQILASAGDARAEYYAGELYGPIFSLLNPYLFLPLNCILQPILVFRSTYRRDFIFWVMAINVLVYASLGGGRLEYLRIAICFLCVIYCIYDLVKSKKKLAFIVLAGAFLLFSMTSITSALRAGYIGLDSSTWNEGVEIAEEHLQSYTAGPIAALDYGLENRYVERIGGYQYGSLTFNSIIRFLGPPLRFAGFNITDPVEKLAKIKQGEIIAFGEVSSFNALYTSLLIYYCDFGVFGILFIPFIMGIFFRRFIFMFYKKQNLPLLILISWMFYCSLRSVTDYPFFGSMDIPLIIILLIWGNTKRKKIAV